MATSDANELFERAKTLRALLEEARSADDHATVDRIESELHRIGDAAAVASVDVQAAQEELITRRIELARIYKRHRRSWILRFLRGGVGSPERFGTDTMPSPSGRGLEDKRSRVVNRINELEERLISADALHVKPLTPDTVLDWRL